MHDSVKTVNGVARVSVAPLGDKVREYLASVVRDGTRPECDGVQVFWEAGDRWGCIRLPSRPALSLANALASPGKNRPATWHPYRSRPPLVDGYAVWDGNHFFLVKSDFNSTADYIDGATIPWWIHKWLPEKMEYASEDTWETLWRERPREVGCMMTQEQAGQVAALIRNRIHMSRDMYLSSRRLLQWCKNKGLPSSKVIMDVLVGAGFTISFPDGIVGDTVTCSVTDWTDGSKDTMSMSAVGESGREAIENILLGLLDCCPKVITALSLKQHAVWPKSTRR